MYDDKGSLREDHDITLVSRLQALTRMANERLREMAPHRDWESHTMVQMMVDELQRVINQLQED
jgi:hypothetical protein